MKVVRSPNPSTDIQKRNKIDLFKVVDPEEVAALREQSARQESNKRLLRLDARTQVLVHPKNANPEYAEKLRQRYKLSYNCDAVGGRKKR